MERRGGGSATSHGTGRTATDERKRKKRTGRMERMKRRGGGGATAHGTERMATDGAERTVVAVEGNFHKKQ